MAEFNTKPKTPFISLNFDLANEKAVETNVAGYKKCTYTKSYKDYSVKAISLNQFAQINNQYCAPRWSKFYVFSTDFLVYQDANNLVDKG